MVASKSDLAIESLSVPGEVDTRAERPTEECTHQNDAAPVYLTLTVSEKRKMVLLMDFAGWFSTVSSFIYFPAITALADELRTTVAKVDLKVASYLVVSAAVPAITGDLADVSGRKPVVIALFAVYVVANVGLAVQRCYPALLALRMIQSAGISGIIALVYGVVADIASPAERGGYVGIVSFCTNTAPALGPLFGTLLLAFRGWTSIFWFLIITAGICLAMIIFLLPETARNIVGNGSIRVYGMYILPFSRSPSTLELLNMVDEPKWRAPNPLTCVCRLRDKDTAILIITLSILYMNFTCLQASLSPLLISIYELTDPEPDLIYHPFIYGCAFAAFRTVYR